jgi:hypothetical protein
MVELKKDLHSEVAIYCGIPVLAEVPTVYAYVSFAHTYSTGTGTNLNEKTHSDVVLNTNNCTNAQNKQINENKTLVASAAIFFFLYFSSEVFRNSVQVRNSVPVSYGAMSIHVL